ncbi:group II intron maturase-specific domain-containing protein [Bradyrhizobium quebecense]|uniref:Uncharacterized protein n=1 Tax=Bradyrhizobium quebecense TaxID=2748629 RepID=A0ACD3V2N2_9BRAD|nr:group II intron maturase-specific domain-containing protein [Bradyrhizobium quebecense]UGA44394.1 hypothetical protein HU230_0040810 [Bradyrhizobium quebecense]UGY00610.1 hypothetical protein J4P68_0025900 [Bradyrhizobium quebecense]
MPNRSIRSSGGIGYYGRFSRSALFSLVDYVNQKLKAWIMRKYSKRCSAATYRLTGRSASLRFV